jgi:hypothetical protein
MQFSHSLISLVVSMGIFAANGSPIDCAHITPVVAACAPCAASAVAVTGEVQPATVIETVSIKTIPVTVETVDVRNIYTTLLEKIPNCGCTNDFTDVANIQLIRDTAYAHGLCPHDVQFVLDGQVLVLNNRREYHELLSNNNLGNRRECGHQSHCGHNGGGYCGNRGAGGNCDNQNINQNMENNQNLNVKHFLERCRHHGHGRLHKRSHRGCHEHNREHHREHGRCDDENQKINQVVDTDGNLLSRLPLRQFFGKKSAHTAAHHPAHHQTPAYIVPVRCAPVVEKGDENIGVNNNVIFSSDGRHFQKRSLKDRCFGDNHNQNINQNMENNQNINFEEFRSRFGEGVDRHFGRDHGCHDGHHGHHGGHCGGCGGFGGHFKRSLDYSDNKNININKNVNHPEKCVKAIERVPCRNERVPCRNERVPCRNERVPFRHDERVPFRHDEPCRYECEPCRYECEPCEYECEPYEYDCDCDCDCCCCPCDTQQTNAQAFALPTVNNFISVDAGATTKTAVDASPETGVEVASVAEASPEIGVDATSVAESSPETQVEASSGSASASDASSESVAGSESIAGLLNYQPTAELDYVNYEPTSDYRLTQQYNYQPTEVKPVEIIKPCEYVKPVECVKPVRPCKPCTFGYKHRRQVESEEEDSAGPAGASETIDKIDTDSIEIDVDAKCDVNDPTTA